MDEIQLFIAALQKEFYANKNESRAAWSKAYMKNKFAFLGLVAADRRKITKTCLQQTNFKNIAIVEKLVLTLWQMPFREFQYAAIEVLAFHKKLWNTETIHLIEHCLTTDSWWDSVDHIIIECVGSYFLQFKSQITINTNG